MDTTDLGPEFEKEFHEFSKFGFTHKEDHRDGYITLKNIDKWIHQAGLSKQLTTTHTAIAFSKHAKTDKVLSYEHFKEFLADLSNETKTDLSTIHQKLQSAGTPGLSFPTGGPSSSAASAVTDRLTDTSHYTGSHKGRFDESGHGTGMQDRPFNPDEDTGYVPGYGEKNTNDKTH